MSLALLGDYRRATGLLTDLLSRFPGCADLWADRGHIYEFRAACEYCDRRATRVQRDRLYTRAARDYRMALRVQPNHVRALVGLGDVVVGSRRRALRYYDRAIEAGRQNARFRADDLGDAYFAKALVLRQLDRRAEAAACFAQHTRLGKPKGVSRRSATGRQPNQALERAGQRLARMAKRSVRPAAQRRVKVPANAANMVTRVVHDESIRSFLLSEVLRFVERARSCPGVRRIALVGSLVRDRHDPKDADVLVTVDDDADLASLATAGRGLKGRAQSRNKGADVFLADPSGTYIGRICHWRECRPGVRLACDARHCGRRPFLHDDLDVVTLDRGLVEAPPLELWPTVVPRARLPRDVKTRLVQPLAGSSAQNDAHGA